MRLRRQSVSRRDIETSYKTAHAATVGDTRERVIALAIFDHPKSLGFRLCSRMIPSTSFFAVRGKR
jgi:hypothetical protein